MVFDMLTTGYWCVSWQVLIRQYLSHGSSSHLVKVPTSPSYGQDASSQSVLLSLQPSTSLKAKPSNMLVCGWDLQSSVMDSCTLPAQELEALRASSLLWRNSKDKRKVILGMKSIWRYYYPTKDQVICTLWDYSDFFSIYLNNVIHFF